MKNFEEKLPEGYRAAAIVDSKNKKTMFLFILGSAVLLIIPFLFLCGRYTVQEYLDYSMAQAWIMMGIFIIYTILHELTHGAAYRILTGQKLKFGIGWGYAYCGVPEIFVYRTASIISATAPFAVWSAVFLILVFTLSGTWSMMFMYVFCCHISGCVGDLYLTWLLAARYRENDVLVKDTGPTMTIYRKEAL